MDEGGSAGAGKKGFSSGAKARGALLIAVGVTVGLYFIPYGNYVIYPLLLISTFVHEMGHGIAGVLVGGTFESFVMHLDGSGAAQVTGASGRIANGIIAAGGLVGPSIGAAALFGMSTKARLAKVGLWLVGAAALVSCILVVRNVFGWVFVGLLGAAAVVVAAKAAASIAQWVLAFLAVQLSLSVYSRSDYLFTDVAHTASGTFPSDVALMADALFLPYWFWGAVCGLISAGVLAFGLWLFWKGTR